MDVNLELLLDTRAILGEGPMWYERRQRLYWVDIEAHKIHETDPATRWDVEIDVGERVGCLAPAGGSLLVLGVQSGFAAFDLDTGLRAAIDDPEHHLPDNRFNDGKCDPAGRFWAGTMAVSEDPACGSLHCLDTDLTVSCKVPGVSVSNGLAWSLDDRTMYYVDSPTREVVAYDYERATGAIANPRRVWQVPEGEGFPDGMTIDRDGCLWVALWDGWRVVRIDPAAGREIAEIRMPVARPTSCVFGGPGLDELFITSARVRLSDEQLREQPLAGGLFHCRPGVKGYAAVEFGGAERLRALRWG